MAQGVSGRNWTVWASPLSSCLGRQLHIMQLFCLWKLDLLPLSEALVGQEKHLEDSPPHGHCGPGYAHLSASCSPTTVENFSSASRITYKFIPTTFVTFVTLTWKHLVLLGARVDRRTKFGIFLVLTAVCDVRAVHNSLVPFSAGGSLQIKRPSLVLSFVGKNTPKSFSNDFQSAQEE